MKPWLAWALALAAVAILAFAANRLTQTTPVVKVGTVTQSEMKGSFTAEGVTKGKEYGLSAEIPGRIVWLGVAEGDSVKAGQALFRMDSAQAEAAVRQSSAALVTAETAVREARAGYSLARDQIESRINQAAAGVKLAQAHLATVKQGTRSEAIDVAEHRLEQARAALKAARLEFQRAQELYRVGAIARASLDSSEATYKSALGEVSAQEDSIALLKVGPTHQEIAEAQSAIDAAKTEYASALRGRDELRVRADAVSGAVSRVEEARGSLSQAQANLPKYTMLAPVDGVVVRLYSELGTMAGPTVLSLTLGTRLDMHIEAEIGSEDAAKVKKGMPVQVTSGAWPGRTFPAHIASLAETGEVKPDAAIRTRILRARVTLDDGFALFKPGLDVDVEGESTLKRALVAPSDALSYEGLSSWVWVFDGSKVHRRNVGVGYASVDLTEILSGLKEGEQVVVAGKENLRDGEVVKVRQ